MGRKHALIVDDSKTARKILGRMLENHDLFVETAESAEEALDYLSHARPDVIFMDHMMPGMDGFQAVKAIKNNPVTATIPIMMYTSQSGDLYVGQARALGAVGVLPKQIKPVEVSALLESLHLIPEEPASPPAATTSESVAEPLGSQPTAQPGVEQVNEPADWTELHGWFAKMLEHHGHVLREDIKTSVARLLEERSQGIADHEDTQSLVAPPADDRRRSPVMTVLIMVLAGFAALFFWLHLDSQEKWREVMAQNTLLLAELDAGRNQVVEQATGVRDLLDTQRQLLNGRFLDFLTALEWTVNHSGSYGPGEIPFSREKLEIIDGLVQRLRAMGFSGILHIDSYVGDFCYVDDGNGGLMGAPADLPADECDQVGLSLEEAIELAGKQSVSFANYLAAMNATDGQDIRIRIEAHGNAQPLYPYPPALQGSTAGEWNRAARRNNHVRIRLLPDSQS